VRPESRLFSFLTPLAWSIWISMVHITHKSIPLSFVWVILAFNLISQAVSYIIVSFAMYVVSQITPLEWRKAAVCNHDDEINDNEFHLCKNSSNSLDGHEHFMSTTEIDGRGNCSENYSTLEQYFKNASSLSEEGDAWMNIEHRKNFLDCNQHDQETRSSKQFDDNLDIDDDGLIGFEEARHEQFPSSYLDDDESLNNIELVSYENNFNLKNSFWWALASTIQTTSDLYPKVFQIYKRHKIEM
jgi:hypothetical protein